MFCPKCGAENANDIKFCSACGAPFEAAPAAPQGDADIQQNKTMAIIAYFIFFIPLIAAKESRFARYHANQGLLLLITSVVLGIANSILSGILWAISWSLAVALTPILSFAVWGVTVALIVIGCINANKGLTKPLPIIGTLFTFFK